MHISDLTQYEILKKEDLKDINSEGYILRHKKTGARVCVISNDDDNKVFYISFRTTPEDETGVAHIIEHTVLCGSDKYPAKDPFIELAKGSLNTFLNAMTGADKTIYPIASCNEQDYKNLMDVYLDAVFHPNITKYEEIFKQEGWHYELEDKDQDIKINGVVYNEMKGAYSSPDRVLQKEIYKSLFPDNTYSQNSGGNPVHIPDLTYEYYLEFYHKYYHPSNSYIFLYGDLDMVERLQWMDQEYLSKYDYLEVDSEVKAQKPFDRIVEAEGSFSVTMDESLENKSYLSFNRVLPESTDRLLYQAFDILEYALVGASGAPVKQALIDAGIGEDVYGSYDGGLKQMVFSIISQNTEADKKEEFLEIIDRVLREQVANGINKDSLIAQINSQEFKFREADFGRFPKGLLYGLQCLDSWNYDDMTPFLHLQCLDTFAELRKLAQTDYFEGLIEKYLLNNTHGSTVVVKPLPGKGDREEQELSEKLSDLKKSLSEAEIQKLIDDTKALKAYQEEPSSEEDLRKIPMLTREDIKKKAMEYSNIETEVSGVKVVRHDIESNGIHYVSLLFDAGDLAFDKLGYIGLALSILGYVDTEDYSYSSLSNQINIYTGGVMVTTSLYPILEKPGEMSTYVEVAFKVLGENLDKAYELAEEMILKSKFDDIKRINEIVAETKTRLQSSLSMMGNSVAAMRSISHFSKYGCFNDEIRGIGFYRFICRVEELLKKEPERVVEELKNICDLVFAKNRLIVSYTAVEKEFEAGRKNLESFIKRLPEESAVGEATVYDFSKVNEAFTDASQIQYVARTGNFVSAGYKYTGMLRLLDVILGYDYLWNNVRVLGGAYGCNFLSLRTGETYLVSYRDPNLEKTNEIYDRIPEYLRNFNPDERDMTKYIIGTFSNIDRPLYPEAKGSRSMSAYMQKMDYEDIQREREAILNASAEDVRGLADLIQAVLDQNNLCVIGNENNIKNAAAMFDSVEKLCN